jgi:hypothetical protein
MKQVKMLGLALWMEVTAHAVFRLAPERNFRRTVPTRGVASSNLINDRETSALL